MKSKFTLSAIGSLTAALEEDTNQTSWQSRKWRIFHIWKMYLGAQSTLGDTGSLKLLNKVTYRVSYWRYCSSRTSGNARNQNVLGINDRHTKRIENRLKHVLISSFCASVRTAHQEQRGTADRNNCQAVVDNPLVKKVKKNHHLHWPLMFISIPAEKRNYTYDTPLKCGVIQCAPLLVQLAFSLSHRGSPGQVWDNSRYVRCNPYYLPGLW